MTAERVYLWHGIPVCHRAACLSGSKMWEKYIILQWKHFKRTRANRVIKLLSPDVLPRAIKIGGLNIYFCHLQYVPRSQQQNTWLNVCRDESSCWDSRIGGDTDTPFSLPLLFPPMKLMGYLPHLACNLQAVEAFRALREMHFKCSPCYKACSQHSHPATSEESVKTKVGWCKSKSDGWILRVLQQQEVSRPTEHNI